MIYLQIAPVRIAESAFHGFPLITDFNGVSVARAKAANVSMIRLIHKSCTAENGDSARMQDPIQIVKRQDRLTVI